MAVDVKWFPTLVKRTKSRKDRTTVDWAAGLTPLAIFRDEGFSETDAEVVMVLINEQQAEMSRALHDGDRLEFLVSLQGG